MADFQRKYGDDQRAAIEQAYGDRGIKSPRTIVALAGAGELTLDGELVPAFALTEASARNIGQRYVKRRERKANAAVAQAAPRDAVEMLRRRLVAVIDEQLGELERRQTRNHHRSIRTTELTGLARAVRELAALALPDGTPTRARPPTKDANRTGSLAGKIRASMAPAAAAQHDPGLEQDHGSEPGLGGERINAGDAGAASESDHERINGGSSGDPGDYVSAHLPGLRAGSVRIERE